MPPAKYRGVSLPKELITAVEKFIKQTPEANYSSIADFVSDAIRIRFNELGIFPGRIALLDINANEKGPLLYDRDLKKSVQIYISPKGIKCGECESDECRHIEYALTKPETRELIIERKKQGWKLPDV